MDERNEHNKEKSKPDIPTNIFSWLPKLGIFNNLPFVCEKRESHSDVQFESTEIASKVENSPRGDLTSYVFSWSLKDICNEKLYRDKVVSIPTTFSSVENYFESFCLPLLEETREDLSSNMEMISEAPVSTVLSIKPKKHSEKLVYDIRIRLLNAGDGNYSESYVPKTGDVLAFSSIRPRRRSDFESNGRSFTLASVIKNENYQNLHEYKMTVQASRSITVEKGQEQSLFAVYLSNITTNSRIWFSLTSAENLSIIRNVLDKDLLAAANGCNECSHASCIDQSELATFFQTELNESQKAAISNSLSLAKCRHKHRVQLVWGPPATGKTKTVSTLLSVLIGKKHRTVACAPTNIAVVQIASRLLKMIRESRGKDYLLGDVVLYGNRQKLKIKEEELEDIFLEVRVEKLAECFDPCSGWNCQLEEMINLLQNSQALYKLQEEKGMSFRKFLVNRMQTISQQLMNHFRIFCVHFSTSFVSMEKIAGLVADVSFVESFSDSLLSSEIDDDALKHVFGFGKTGQADNVSYGGQKLLLKIMELRMTRMKCIKVLEILREGFAFPFTGNKIEIREFCLAKATVVLCTAASSFKLRSVEMDPLELCVIDEAALLKECESLIPLQLNGVRNAILIGDECQLSAMVTSQVSEKAGFGRSLFQRLVSLGQEKERLAVQYRMHPSISFFPNSCFYSNMIHDGDNVKSLGFERRYLKGEIFGPYSFINIAESTECLENQRSQKNLIEVAVIARIVQMLFKAYEESKREVSVGIISPYTGQVSAISEKLGKTYDSCSGFQVKIKTVDGFQGGEEDIIIISTVRANNGGNVGFLSNLQRTNVALTRAKYCLWILGHEPTLVSSRSIWKKVLEDARNRNCFFDADEDESLAEAIINAKMELGEFDDLLQADSVLFRKAKWKVSFAESFKISFEKTEKVRIRKEAVEVLIQLSNGNRPRKNLHKFPEGSSIELLQLNLVGGDEYCLFWSVDVQKSSYCSYEQLLKFWAFLPQEEAPKLVKRLKKIFSDYREDHISRCKFKLTERGLEVPMRWEVEEDESSLSENEVEDLSTRLASFDFDD